MSERGGGGVIVTSTARRRRGPDTTEPPAAGLTWAAVERGGLRGPSPSTASSRQNRKPRAQTTMTRQLTVVLWVVVRSFVHSFVHPGNRLHQLRCRQQYAGVRGVSSALESTWHHLCHVASPLSRGVTSVTWRHLCHVPSPLSSGSVQKTQGPRTSVGRGGGYPALLPPGDSRRTLSQKGADFQTLQARGASSGLSLSSETGVPQVRARGADGPLLWFERHQRLPRLCCPCSRVGVLPRGCLHAP